MDEEDVFAELLEEKKTTSKIGEGSLCGNDSFCEQSEHTAQALIPKQNQIIDKTSVDSLFFVLVSTANATFVQVYDGSSTDGTDSQSDTKKLKWLKELATGLEADRFSDERVNHKVLFVARCREGSSSSCNDPGVVDMPKSLFISLFGKESALINSPIILLASTTGHVFYCSLNTLSNISASFVVCCQLRSPIVNIMAVRLQKVEYTKMCKNQEIISSLNAALGKGGESHDENWETGLLVCSACGENCMFLPPQDGIPSVIPWSTPQSIQSCIVSDNMLVCSSGTCVSVYELTLSLNGQRSKVVPKLRNVKENVNITQLLPAPCINDVVPEVPTVTGLTTEFISIPIPLCNKEIETTAGKDINRPAKVSDTLKQIRDISKQMKILRDQTASVNSYLQQLNIFRHLKHFHKCVSGNYQVASGHQSLQGVSCSSCVQLENNGYQCSWTLSLKVTNNMPLSFSDQWSVSVCVQPAPSKLTGKLFQSETFTIPLHDGLKTNSTQVFSFPLDNILKQTSCPNLSVSVFLSLKMCPDALSSKVTGEKQNDSAMLQVRINKCCVDIVHFLTWAEDTEYRSCRSWGKDSLDREISALPRIAHSGVQKAKKDCDKVTALLYVSSRKDENQFQAPADVLRYLFHDNREIKALNASFGQFISPAGARISLAVAWREDKLSKDGNESNGKKDDMVLTIESSDVEMLLETRQAIKSRLLGDGCHGNTGVGENKKRLQRKLIKLQQIKEQLIHHSSHSDDDTSSSHETALLKLCKNL